MPKKPVLTLKTAQRYPIEFGSKEAFLLDVREQYQRDVSSNYHNIEPAREDMAFVIGDQWHSQVRADRERLNKPVLTINRLPAFVAQYVGAWLQNDTTIKILPSRGGTKKCAEIRQGIIRTILRTTPAKRALRTAMETSYICGVGNFGISLVEAKDDVFARDVEVDAYPDPFQVVWDRGSIEPTGADAQRCFVFDWMTREDFKKAYPKATPSSGWASDDVDFGVMSANGYDVNEMVRICKFWQMKEESITLGLEADTGDVVDVSDWDETRRAIDLASDKDGSPIVRETVHRYAECYVLSGEDVLEGPHRLDVPRVPVFRVEGWALQEGPVRFRWGFIRFAKDPQRLHNYMRSMLAEQVQKSPVGKWLLDKVSMVGGLDKAFRNQHMSNDPLLYWDSQATGMKPEFIPPQPLDPTLMAESQMTTQDIKDVTNKHEASLGVRSNEVSGRAIAARQRVSELGDVVYIENMNAALAECGVVLNALIPVVYDTHRTVKVTGEDDVETLEVINEEGNDDSPDLTKGKYDLTYSTGPSYATKRQEAVDLLMTLMNTMPQVGNVVADIIVRNMDVPGAEELSARLASLLPPGMVDPEMLPERLRERAMQAQESQNQQAQQQAQAQQMMFQAQLEKLAAEIMNLKAQTAKNAAQADVAASQVGVDAANAAIKSEKNDIDAAKVGVQAEQTQADYFIRGLENAAAERAAEQKEADDGDEREAEDQ